MQNHPSPPRALERPTPAILANETPLCPRHLSLQCVLDAEADNDSPLLHFHDAGAPEPDRRTSLKQLRERAHRYARALLAEGIGRGDRVLLLLKTGETFVEAFLGCMLAGAIPVPLPSTFTFGTKRAQLDALSPIAASADAAALITTPQLRAELAAATSFAAQLRRVLTPLDLDGLGPAPRFLPSSSAAQPAFIQYTSGTTGRPKGAVISQRALTCNAAAIADALALGPATVGVSWLPLFHDMGLVGVLLTALAHPYQLHLMPPESFLFRPQRWLELMARCGATLTAAPNFAYELCVTRDVPVAELDLSALRTMLSGAETVHPQTFERFARHCTATGLRPAPFVPVYGLAEATLAVTFSALDTPIQTYGSGRSAIASVGRPVAGTSCSIQAAGGRILAEREHGEIVVRSHCLMDGYFRDEQASLAALRDGALHTGDLGFIADGSLYVTGRKKDLIIKGGRNIHPEDVELAARQADARQLGAVAAVARPNPTSGTEDLILFAETRERDPLSRQQLQKGIVGEVLAALGVKVDAVHLCRIGALPRTTSGKVKRTACASLLRGEP